MAVIREMLVSIVGRGKSIMSQQTQKKREYTIDDLGIWYIDNEGEAHGLERFALDQATPTSEMSTVAFPQDFDWISTQIGINDVTVSEDTKTQRYVVTYTEFIRDGPDKPVFEVIKRKSFYSMHQYDLRLTFKAEESE